MAILERIIDKDLLSSFWGNASERIDARIAAAKASLATPSTAGLVKPGSGLAVASDGTLSAKVDGSTIDFNSSGQLTALGGGGGALTPFYLNVTGGNYVPINDSWQVKNSKSNYDITITGYADASTLIIDSFSNAHIDARLTISATNGEIYFYNRPGSDISTRNALAVGEYVAANYAGIKKHAIVTEGSNTKGNMIMYCDTSKIDIRTAIAACYTRV